MDSLTRQIQQRKRLAGPTPDPIRFAVSVLNNAWALKKWQVKMHVSMKSYIQKVSGSISQIFNAGAKLLADSNHPRMHRLMKKLVVEKDRCDWALKRRKEQMDSLITQVMRCSGNNSILKQKVLDLLQVMRRPALPDLSFIYRSVGRKMPGNKMRTKLPFRIKDDDNRQ